MYCSTLSSDLEFFMEKAAEIKKVMIYLRPVSIAAFAEINTIIQCYFSLNEHDMITAQNKLSKIFPVIESIRRYHNNKDSKEDIEKALMQWAIACRNDLVDATDFNEFIWLKDS